MPLHWASLLSTATSILTEWGWLVLSEYPQSWGGCSWPRDTPPPPCPKGQIPTPPTLTGINWLAFSARGNSPQEMCLLSTSLVPRPFWEGETAWQLPRVQTVYGRNVTAIAYLIQSVKSTWYFWYFHRLRTVLSCSWKQLFAQVLRRKLQAEDERTKDVVQSTYTSAIERSTIVMNGRDCDVSTHDAIRFTVVMWQRSEIWLGLPTLWQRK